ncbi:flagellar hook-associated protein FlgK [Halovulum sp. GXIMD14794]
MSLSTALTNALSGLRASTLEAELVSNNVANAQTPGYTKRTAELASATVGSTGAGVRVAGVALVQDPAVLASRRVAEAGLASSDVALDAATRLSDRLGQPGDPSALAQLATDFKTALQGAANDPTSDTALDNVVRAASRLTDAIGTLSTETQRMRMTADAEIAGQVQLVNDNLREIESLNRQIQMISTGGGDASALVDARKALIDEVNTIIPIREVPRENGAVALYSGNGATLLDGVAGEIGFAATPVIGQGMSVANGDLSGLTLNGRSLTVGTAGETGLADGGSLGALFTLRDTTLPAFSGQLDALAADLVTRFQDPGLDPSRAAGDPGLFTDAGAALAPGATDGLAARLELNAQVDPATGGASWRLRDGLYAAAPGAAGDGSLLAALDDALTGARVPDATLGLATAGSFAQITAGFTGRIAGEQASAEIGQSHDMALATALRNQESAGSGVDTDEQMQRLLLIERSYAANAMVMSTVNDMIRSLMEI